MRSLPPLPNTRTKPSESDSWVKVTLYQFRDTQSGCIQQLKHGAIAQVQRRIGIGRAQQRLYLIFGQRLWKSRRFRAPSGEVWDLRDAAVSNRPPIKPSQHGQPPIGGERKRGRMLVGKVLRKIRFSADDERGTALHKPIG